MKIRESQLGLLSVYWLKLTTLNDNEFLNIFRKDLQALLNYNPILISLFHLALGRLEMEISQRPSQSEPPPPHPETGRNCCR